MFGLNRAIAPPLVAIALICMTPLLSNAAPVTYSTTGVFTAVAPDTGTGTSVLTSNNATLAFTGLPNTYEPIASLPDTDVSLGNFSLTMPKTTTSGSFAAGDKFTLTITQSDPAGGSKTSTASVTGSISNVTLQSGDSASYAILTFAPNPIVLNNISYLINDLKVTWTGQIPASAGGTLTADVATVPLPATANMGLAAFAGMGVLGLWRKWKVSKEALA